MQSTCTPVEDISHTQSQCKSALLSQLDDSSVSDTQIINFLTSHQDIIFGMEFMDEQLHTLLHRVVLANRIAIVTMLCTTPFAMDLTAKNLHGRTAFHLAASKGFTRIAVLLLQYKPSLTKVRDHMGHSALYYALVNHHFVLVNCLVHQFGMSFMEQNQKTGNSFIQYAITNEDVELFQFLCKESGMKEALIRIENSEGMNGLLTCAWTAFHSKRNYSLITEELMKSNLENFIKSKDQIGRNVLYFACLHDNISFVRLFIEYVFRFNKSTKKKRNANTIIEQLLFEVDDVFHLCPLAIAISNGFTEIVSTLAPFVKNWNDERFLRCFKLFENVNSTSAILQFAVKQIIDQEEKNPITNISPLRLVATAKVLMQHEARVESRSWKKRKLP